MRARVLAAAVLLACSVSLPVRAANIDLVVMVDTSTSMFPYFDDLIHYLLQDLLKDRLHSGDSFHLLSFSSTPEEELSLEIGGQQDVEKAFGRILLLQPLGRYTDLIAGLRFLYRYVRELPETNPKTILLLTDGVHDPPPGSQNRVDPVRIRAAIQEIAGQIEKQGWAFHILKVPPQPVAGEEGLKSYLPELADALHTPVVPYKTEDRTTITGKTTGFPTLRFPPDLGRIPRRFTAPFRVTNYRSEPIIVRLVGVEADGTEMLERKVSVTVPARKDAALDVPLQLPAGTAQGDHKLTVRLRFEDDLRISPTEGEISFTFTGGAGLRLPRVDLLFIGLVALAVVVIVLLVLLFLFMRRKLHEVSLPRLERAAEETRPGAPPLRRVKEQEPARAGVPARREAQPTPPPLRPQDVPAAQAVSPAPARGRRLVPLMEAPSAGGLRRAALAQPPRRLPVHTVESIQGSLPQSLGRTSLPPFIEMRVSGQNTQIGFRNIHRMPPGGSLSVGGRFSGFCIFLVPVPRGIAQIRNDSGRYVFVPVRAEYFPSLSGPVMDCLDAEIPLLTPRGFACTIRFRQWVSPLEEINALMRSIRRD